MKQKKRLLLRRMEKVCIFLFVMIGVISISNVVYAKTQVTGKFLEAELKLTEENRYQNIFYQEPEKRYPVNKGETNIQGINVQSEETLTLEEYIVKALSEFQENINVSAYNVTVQEGAEIYFQILNNHPELFYVAKSIRYSYSGNRLISYVVSYTDTVENIKIQKQAFDAEVEEVLEQVDTSAGELEQALMVHDYIVLKCEYDYERVLNTGTVPDISHSAYGALVNEIAVCDGYASAYSYIMEQKLGIPCDIVSSDAMNHAWNMICLDGKWYHIDVTWDDPTWDSVGRVCHDYFLLSDTAVSDTEHDHKGWIAEHTADSFMYDNAFWSNIRSAICYFNKEWYYSKANAGNYKSQLFKKSELLGTDEECIYTEQNYWNNWVGSFIYLDIAGTDLYFNTTTTIKKIGTDGNIENVYEPELSGNQLIFGFKIEENILYYALQEAPNLSAVQKLKEYVLPGISKPEEPQPEEPQPEEPEEPELQEITGITAEDIVAIYDGTTKQIVVKGVLEGDIILYAGEDGVYSETQPEMVNAGIYRVSYRIERDGYHPYEGTVTVEIQKAVPTYTVPEDLSGKSGETLGAIALPEGFEWQSAEDTRLYTEGSYTYYVTYHPQDKGNYVSVTDIEVTVIVNCPGHEYNSEVIKEATETSVGSVRHTCEHCGDSYTEEITMLEPENPKEEEPKPEEPKEEESKPEEPKDEEPKPEEPKEEESKPENPKDEEPKPEPKPEEPKEEESKPEPKPEENVECTEIVSNLKISQTTGNTLKFTWKKTAGIKYRLVLYKGNKKVSTIYTDKNVYTYKKLTTGAIYSLKITPYKEDKGNKIYSANTRTLKAATTPAKVKWGSVKKSGSKAAKITWKKVSGVSGYEVYMKTGNGKYKKIKTTKVLTLKKSALKKGKKYSFKVRAYITVDGKNTYGAYSAVKTLKL